MFDAQNDIYCLFAVALVLVIMLISDANKKARLYEAAELDGANRWKQILHITIPSIMPTIIITVANILELLFIFSVSFVF